jgi:hypothetical protein
VAQSLFAYISAPCSTFHIVNICYHSTLCASSSRKYILLLQPSRCVHNGRYIRTSSRKGDIRFCLQTFPTCSCRSTNSLFAFTTITTYPFPQEHPNNPAYKDEAEQPCQNHRHFPGKGPTKDPVQGFAASGAEVASVTVH